MLTQSQQPEMTRDPAVARRHASSSADWILVAVLSMTAGAVDVIGFLTLGGLFVAHITGNLVVLAAHYVTGGFGQIGPLLSVPVFIIVLGVITGLFADKVNGGTLRTLLVFEAVVLLAFLGLGVGLGPFSNPDSGMAVFVGMLGVVAMATQNAVIRLELPRLPTTAVITTNTVQLAIDLAVLIRGQGEPEDLKRARGRAPLTFLSVAGFAIGCAVGGILELHLGLWALVLPVALSWIALGAAQYAQQPMPAAKVAHSSS